MPQNNDSGFNSSEDLKFESLFNTLDSDEQGWTVVLQKTIKLKKGQLPRLEALYKQSHSSHSPIPRYICTFLNSVIFHKRFFFLLNAKAFFAMVRSDKNHPPRLRTFNDRLWQKFFAVLLEEKIILIREEGGEKFIEISDEWLKTQLALELSQSEIKKIHEAQRKQTIDFIKNKSNSSVSASTAIETFSAAQEAGYYSERELLGQVENWKRLGNKKNAEALLEQHRLGNYKKQ